MSLWDHFLHRLWKRVGEPGMQCRGPHVSPGDEVTVRWTTSWSGVLDCRTGVVESVTCDGVRVLSVVLRDAAVTPPDPRTMTRATSPDPGDPE